MKTVFAVQEFFIGQWSDNFVYDDLPTATRSYERERLRTPRRVRLIERTETVVHLDNKMVPDWAQQ